MRELFLKGSDLIQTELVLMLARRSFKIKKLHLAVKNDNRNEVCIILQSHPHLVDEMQKKDWQNREASLHLAARLGSKDMVKLLLEEGANPRLRDTSGQTALHVALHSGKEDVAQVLCDLDSKNDLKGASGRTPLHLAAQRGYAGIARKLLAGGANTRAQCSYGATPLHYALLYGGKEVSEVLVDLDSGNDLVDDLGQTPLHRAAEKGYAEVVRKLLLSNVRPHVRTKTGVYPLWYAVKSQQHNIAAMILSMCAWQDIEIDWKDQRLEADEIQYCIRVLSECLAEIQKMRDRKLQRTTVSFYDLAKASVRRVALYLENEELHNELSKDLLLDYPNYAVLIDWNVRNARKRKALTNQWLECFAILTRDLPSLSRIGIDAVLFYLSEKEDGKFC